MPLASGSIAFTGFNVDGGSPSLAFVVLTDIPAGTVIRFSENEWRGTSFNTGEGDWSWTATSDIAAGSVVTMDALNSASPTSNQGTISLNSGVGIDLTQAGEIVYAYVGDPATPTFLAAFANDTFTSDGGKLDGTGLIEGVNAVAMHAGSDIAAYVGPRDIHTNFADYLADLNNVANWKAETDSGDDSHDGTTPDLPFSVHGFSDSPNPQVVGFQTGSLSVTHAEGNSGNTILSFTVERTGGTTGAVDFSGAIQLSGTTHGDDFGVGSPMSFSGTIADGQTTGTIEIVVSGDLTFEPDETFTLALQHASNATTDVVLGDATIATGTITNDDPAPVDIAFVGFNADGTDNLAFVALSDIAAGTVIHFTDSDWNGSGFKSGESMWSWTADSTITAGTVITLDDLKSASATSNHGTITFTAGTSVDLPADLSDIVYAYLGTPTTPSAFLTAIGNSGSLVGALTGTGLTQGVNAVTLSSSIDISYYNGPRTGFTSFEQYRAAINNPANWTTGGNTNLDDSHDGALPNVPFQALPFSTDPTAQVVQFQTSSVTVSKAEGSGGTETLVTFTVERTGGTTGDLNFTAFVPVGTFADAASAADFFGDALPQVTGTIPAGQTSTTVTVSVKGDTLFENAEKFFLQLQSASNPDASSVVVGERSIATVTITNDDSQPTTVHAGEVHTAPFVLTGSPPTASSHLVIEEGGSTAAISYSGTNVHIVVDNHGQTGSITAVKNTTGEFTLNNYETGVIVGVVSAEKVKAGTGGTTTSFTLNNDGRITLNARMDFDDVGAVGKATINNSATGIIEQTVVSEDISRPGANGVVNNYGTVKHSDGLVGGGDGFDFQAGTGGQVHNYGTIDASRHAVTGDKAVTVINEADGVMIGRNGSAVNLDTDGTVAQTAYITNHGRMEGRSAHLADSDGDAVDVDGLVDLTNDGFIGGMGHNGYHDGEPNVGEGVAVGGGIIRNLEGGEIYGYGRAIQVDNSSNANALGTTIIENAGLIQGDGNLPTNVTEEEVAQFAERIIGGEAIDLVGNYGDSLTNAATGEIIGGVKMGGGDDILINAGLMSATGGSAIDMGDGNDTVTLQEGSEVFGQILLGAGDDTFTAIDGDLDIDAGAGNDTVTTGEGDDTVVGGTGDDILDAGDGDDFVDGGDDNDTLIGGLGDDELQGGLGNDVLRGGDGDDNLDGGDGIDTADYASDTVGVHVDLSAGEAFGDATGADTLTGIENVIGGSGNDTLIGDDGDNVFAGGLGNDTIDGGDGFDTLDLSGATGPVTLNIAAGRVSATGLGTDTFSHIENFTFGAGNDQVTGGNGNESVDGGAGDDKLAGGAGDDALTGGAGNDNVDGGSGDDQVSGGLGNDVLAGGSGDDHVDGGEGNDTIDAGSGNDTVVAGIGNDTVTGGSGDDRIEGGAGDDTLTGGSGHDTFVFAEGFGHDTIKDFAVTGSSSDIIEVSTDLFTDFADFKAAAHQDGSNVVVTVGDDTLTLANVALTSLQADDFRFV